MKASQGSITITTGAGGLSISPHISVRGFVREDSPAFRLFDLQMWRNELSKWDDKHKLEVLAKRAEDTLRQLRILFDTGEAAPSDVDIDGRTVMKVS